MTAELIEGTELRSVPPTNPAVVALTTAQQAELAAAESQARAAGLTHLRLETGTLQHEAIALYTNHGYHPTPPYPPFTNEPASRCYAKDL